MFTVLTVATVTGVPFETFLGQLFGWHIAFMTIVGIGIMSFIGNMILVPSDLPKALRTTFCNQLKLVSNGRLLLVFIITALGYGGTFVVFMYLSSLLQGVTGFNAGTGTVMLLCKAWYSASTYAALSQIPLVLSTLHGQATP